MEFFLRGAVYNTYSQSHFTKNGVSEVFCQSVNSIRRKSSIVQKKNAPNNFQNKISPVLTTAGSSHSHLQQYKQVFTFAIFPTPLLSYYPLPFNCKMFSRGRLFLPKACTILILSRLKTKRKTYCKKVCLELMNQRSITCLILIS